MALVLFSTGTVTRRDLRHNFTSPMRAAINQMDAVANTNLSDGLIAGHAELQSDPSSGSVQALVFFTDGRPTALRDVFPVNGNDIDAVITCSQDPAGNVSDQLYRPDDLDRRIQGALYTPNQFPDGSPRTVLNLQNLANTDLLNAAAQARADRIPIFVIALGNPNANEAWVTPDCQLLIQVANVREGIDPATGSIIQNPSYDPSQPKGGFYFAPDATELGAIFDQVAREIVLRLTT
jgi:hypothetical protein